MQVLNDRLQHKTFESLLKKQLFNDYSLSKVESRMLARDLTQLMDSCEVTHLKPGQAVYLAVSAKENNSKPVKECSQVKIVITLFNGEDINQQSIPLLRRMRILRITKEAFSQGALLTQEDLSALLCVDVRTIKRDITSLKKEGQIVPTRGVVKDIGKATTHKAQAVKLFLEGRQFSEITRTLYHSPSAILRYLRVFVLVASLKLEGLSNNQIISMNLASPALINEYLVLYRRYVKNIPSKLNMLKERLSGKKGEQI